MRLSLYTFVKDGLYYDFHVVAMLKHHLQLADEIVVNEGYSSDGTYEAIKDIDPRIRVVRNNLDQSEPKAWLRKAKDQARRLCTGDWCVLLDSDEFIPEWDFQRLRAGLAQAREDVLGVKYRHFYGSYRVQYEHPDRPFPPRVKHILHRNRPDIEILGDGSDVRVVGAPAQAETVPEFECHHFGEVRKAARLRHKWRVQGDRDIRNRWSWLPAFAFDLRPHDWFDKDFLPHLRVYEGPYVAAVERDPDEFVRDDMALYRWLTGGDE